MPYNRREFVKSGFLLGLATVQLPRLITKEETGGDRIVLLGIQGGPVIRSYQSSPAASLIVYRNVPYVIDTGYGVTFKLVESGVSLPSLQHIFITHHHSDHNLELGPLMYNAWVAGLSQTLHVHAPSGLKSLLDYYWLSNRFDIETRIKDEGRPDIRTLVDPHEIEEGEILSNADVTVTALRNIHPPVTDSYALKFKLGNKIVVFSGDTAYCPALAELASGADYLIHEVMYKPAIDALVKRRPNAGKLKASILSHHTAAEDVGRIASQAKVKCLVLNHFVPPDDLYLTAEVWKDAVSKTFTGRILVGRHLLRLPL
jgi:ribonuclease BN (tRNA processing enzyme)